MTLRTEQPHVRVQIFGGTVLWFPITCSVALEAALAQLADRPPYTGIRPSPTWFRETDLWDCPIRFNLHDVMYVQIVSAEAVEGIDEDRKACKAKELLEGN